MSNLRIFTFNNSPFCVIIEFIATATYDRVDEDDDDDYESTTITLTIDDERTVRGGVCI